MPNYGTTSDVQLQAGDIIDHRYRVQRVLGVGGMGVVALATHTALKAQVALKFLRPSVAQNPRTAARFLTEAQAAVRIKSPYVCRVTDVGSSAETGTPYMVMEYLEGRDLAQIIDQDGPLDVEAACLYALQTCEALAAAHTAGIVHRDVKPENLFLTTGTDGSPVIKVVDFGISKNTVDHDSKLTQTQVSMGSPFYMSPEQMRSARDVDPRSDVWSMGVTLFELLTGQPPFIANSMPQLCSLVLEQAAPQLTEVLPDAPQALSDVIARCLQKERSQRFPSVDMLARAIAEVVPGWGHPYAERCTRILTGAYGAQSVTPMEFAAVDLPPPSEEPTARRMSFGITAIEEVVTGRASTGIDIQFEPDAPARPRRHWSPTAVSFAAVILGLGAYTIGRIDRAPSYDGVHAGAPANPGLPAVRQLVPESQRAPAAPAPSLTHLPNQGAEPPATGPSASAPSTANSASGTRPDTELPASSDASQSKPHPRMTKQQWKQLQEQRLRKLDEQEKHKRAFEDRL